MQRFIRGLLCIGLVCAPALLAAQGAVPTGRRQDRDILTAEQIRELHVENAYDAVQASRSSWLRERGPTSFSAMGSTTTRSDSLTGTVPLVYLDRVKLGPVDELKRIPIRAILNIQHLSGLEATGRYGVGHSAGVILVTTVTMSGVTPSPLE